jgi:hypothetical protein
MMLLELLSCRIHYLEGLDITLRAAITYLTILPWTSIFETLNKLPEYNTLG